MMQGGTGIHREQGQGSRLNQRSIPGGGLYRDKRFRERVWDFQKFGVLGDPCINH